MTKKHFNDPYKVLVALAAVLLSLSLLAVKAGQRLQHHKPDIILITAGALRPDHLGCYGYFHMTTPGLDALAGKGATFNRAYSDSANSVYSYASILSGRYSHSAISHAGDELLLDEDIKLLPEYLRENGYTTIALTGDPSFQGHTGFEKGFDLFEKIPDISLGGIKELSGSLTSRAILALKEYREKKKPVFIWIV